MPGTMASVATPPRASVLRNLSRVMRVDVPNPPTEGNRDSVPPTAPGEMQLFSYYVPSLTAQKYTITVSQDVDVPFTSGTETEKLNLGPLPFPDVEKTPQPDTTHQTQTFEVIAPQFKIEDKDFHSMYPPQGHADQPNVLPHIVFNDPHLPWERPIFEATSDDDDVIPWLAVFPFDCNGQAQELRLTEDQLNGDKAVYKKFNSNQNRVLVTQSSNFTVAMTVQEYLKLATPPSAPAGTTTVHIPAFDLTDSEITGDVTPVEVIFLSGKLFKFLFPLDPSTKMPDVRAFRFLSHVRNVNTAGMTISSGIGDTGLFSIVHSKRTGPTDIKPNTAPRSQSVHLISLENVEQMDVPGILDDHLVAFISLKSWNYLCQPPLTVNFVDSMRAIGDQMKDKTQNPLTSQSCLLRCPDDLLTLLQTKVKTVGTNLANDLGFKRITSVKSQTYNRLADGYSLVRHRAASGEETVALNRGPLIPVRSTPPSTDWPYASNNGQDYQIFDSTLGLMDTSYSSAWQIGKMLATSDMGLVAALMRHRADLHQQGTTATSILLHEQSKSRVNVMSNLKMSMLALNRLTSPSTTNVVDIVDQRQRWAHVRPLVPRVADKKGQLRPLVKAAFAAGVKAAGQNAASATAPNTTSNSGQNVPPATGGNSTQPFNEMNAAKSSDWAFIHSWILDKMYLHGIPTHYLVGDPSFLPPESIRFFHIDKNWIGCLVDGALSVANHMAQDDDAIRDSIKNELNTYFQHKFSTTTGKPLHYPQVPRYGFFLRSAVVTIFPDLIITAPYPSDDVQSGQSEVLVTKHLGKDILMVLLDRLPEQLMTIKISQPPHQQRFSVGDILDDQHCEFLFRKMWRQPDADSAAMQQFLHEFGGPRNFFPPKTGDPAGTTYIYDWQSHCLDLNALESYMFSPTGLFTTDPTMSDEWGTAKGTFKLTSAMVGLQLNDTIKYLEIKPPASATHASDPQTPYTLRTPETPDIVEAASKKLVAFKSVKAVARPLPKSIPPTTAAKDTAKTLTPPVIALPPSFSKATKPARPSTTPRSPPRDTGPVPATNTIARQLTTPGPRPRERGFKYAIYPSTSAAPDRSFVFTDTPYIPDLIFAINITPAASASTTMFLREVRIRVPIGDPSLRDAPEPEIGGMGLVPVGASAGTRARMLSNQRWVAHIDTSKSYQTLRLIPRSTNLSVPLRHNKNLTFKLDEVDITGMDVARKPDGSKPAKTPVGHGTDLGKVTVGIMEIYGPTKTFDPLTWDDQGVATDRFNVLRRKGWKDPLEGLK